MLSAAGRWFGDSLAEVEWYIENECSDGEVMLIRLPTVLAERYRVANIPLKPGGKDAPENPAAFSRRPSHEFFLPRCIIGFATSCGSAISRSGFSAEITALHRCLNTPARASHAPEI